MRKTRDMKLIQLTHAYERNYALNIERDPGTDREQIDIDKRVAKTILNEIKTLVRDKTVKSRIQYMLHMLEKTPYIPPMWHVWSE